MIKCKICLHFYTIINFHISGEFVKTRGKERNFTNVSLTDGTIKKPNKIKRQTNGVRMRMREFRKDQF